MGLFDKFKKTKRVEPAAKKYAGSLKVTAPKEETPKETAMSEVKKETVVKVSKKGKVSGVTQQADKILIKPLVTEKAAAFGAVGKYIFVINPSMNKVEVKKAIRKVYGVEPVNVRIINVSGKQVRFGRTFGRTKDWKKAIVTLKEGDKIEIYEGV